MLKKVIIIIGISISVSSIYSCDNEKRNEKHILKELKQGEINSEQFSKIFENKESLLRNYDDEELITLASIIYTHIGSPISKQDTERLSIAVEFLDESLKRDSLNYSAYTNKNNILIAMGNWNELLVSINSWQKRCEPNYNDYMLQGFVFEKIGRFDTAKLSFKIALNLLDEKIKYDNRNINLLIQRVVIISFLYGKDDGLIELDKIIKETNNDFAKEMKESIFDNFDKQNYIENHVFKKPELLNPSL